MKPIFPIATLVLYGLLSGWIPRSGCSGLNPGAEHVDLILAPVEQQKGNDL